MREVGALVRRLVDALARSGFAVHQLARAVQAELKRRRCAAPAPRVDPGSHYEQPILRLRWRHGVDPAAAALDLAQLLEAGRQPHDPATWRSALADAAAARLSAQTVLAWRAHVADRLLRRKTFQGADFGWPDHDEPQAVAAAIADVSTPASELAAVLERLAGPCYVRVRPIVEWYLRQGLDAAGPDDPTRLPPLDADAAACLFQASRRVVVACIAEGNTAVCEPELPRAAALDLRRRLATALLRHLGDRRAAYCRELVDCEAAARAFLGHQRSRCPPGRTVRRGRSARWDAARCREFARALDLLAAYRRRGDATQAAAVGARAATWLERHADWAVLARTETWLGAAEPAHPVPAETVRRLAHLRRRVERLEGRLVLEHEALVHRAARPWIHTSFRDDALQVGRLELLRALRQHDPDQGTLTTYALRCMTAALRRPMAAMMQSVSASANDRRFHHRIRSFLATEDAPDAVSDRELSRRAGVPLQRVRSLRQVQLVAEDGAVPALDEIESASPAPDENLLQREQASTAAARLAWLLQPLSDAQRIALAAETDLLSVRDAVDRWVSAWLAQCRERAAQWRPWSPA